MISPLARFRFVPMGSAAPASSISCDGLVEGAALHLTHWKKNQTPAALKADTSTEIAFLFIDSPLAEAWKHSPVVNNHFDTDGVLSIVTLLDPAFARQHRALFIAAAEAGDFQEWPTLEDGIRLDAALTQLGAAAVTQLGGPAHTQLGGAATDEARAFAAVLPQVPELVTNLRSREDLWGPAWQVLRAGMQAMNDGLVTLHRRGDVSIVRHSASFHAGRTRELPGPLLHRAHPDARFRWMLFDCAEAGDSTSVHDAASRTLASSTVALGTVSGPSAGATRESSRFHARLEWPRHAWADTVHRLPPDPLDPAELARSLGSGWRVSPTMPGTTGLIETTEPVSELPDLPALR